MNYDPSVLAKTGQQFLVWPALTVCLPAHLAWLAPALCFWHAKLQISLNAPHVSGNLQNDEQLRPQCFRKTEQQLASPSPSALYCE